MKKFIILLTLIIFTQDFAVAADVVKVGDLAISSAWSRASTGIKRPSAVYLSISNASSEHDRLTAVHTPTAKRAELHRHFMVNGVMRMRQVDAMEVPAASMTMLKPGDFHIMLFDMKSLLKEGDMFPISLTFEKAGKSTIMVQVAKVGASNAKHLHNMKSEGHEKYDDIHLKHGSAPAQ